jgi:hypothetical protein
MVINYEEAYIMNEIKSLKEIVESLVEWDRSLLNNKDFRLLAKIAGVELPRTLDECAEDMAKSLMKFGTALAGLFKTDQERRDEIVENAKRDIANLVEFANTDYAKNVEFVVNREKRTVVALLKGFHSGRVFDKGIAKCSPNDCFNVHIGKAIALWRALGLSVPYEYMNVPQPTEVRVGDFIKSGGMVYEVVEKKDWVSTDWTCTVDSYRAKHMVDRIIDDSRE